MKSVQSASHFSFSDSLLDKNRKASRISHYHSEFMKLTAHQEFKVINLWEVDAEMVFNQNFNALLPFVPVMHGGSSEEMLSKAIVRLRADESIAEMEPMLAFFASFVLQSTVVKRIMRWDMTILRESPWYNELIQEGLEQGIEQGLEQGIERGIEQGEARKQDQILLQILGHRFGSLSYELQRKIRALRPERKQELVVVALDADSLTAVSDYLAAV